MRGVLIFTIVLLMAVSSLFAQPKESSIVMIGGQKYYVHVVQKGETKFSLAQQYGVSQYQLEEENPQIIDGLKTDQVLKIPVVQQGSGVSDMSRRKVKKLYDTHVVKEGETLFAISRQYEIPISVLMEDNESSDPTALPVGRTLYIRKESVGESSPVEIKEEMVEYKEAINKVSEDVIYHLVERGETLFGVGYMYGVTEEAILYANKNIDGQLKAGMLLMIPKLDKEAIIERGDSVVRYRKIVDVYGVKRAGDINVSLLLPMSYPDGAVNNDYLDFYQGALMALQELKDEGVATKVALFDTRGEESDSLMWGIIGSSQFQGSDIVVGPVYESSLDSVLRFAENKQIAVVSPLATMEKEESTVLYQLAPSVQNKFDKIKRYIESDSIKGRVNVLYIHCEEFADQEFEDNLRSLVAQESIIVYDKETFAKSQFIDKYANRGENCVIISCSNEQRAEIILASISSIQNNMVARSMAKTNNISVVGNSKWARFKNVDKNLFFKLNLIYPSSYHADRSNERVLLFDKEYIGAFSTIPSLYTYRGYDAVKLFVGSLKNAQGMLTEEVNLGGGGLLQTSYEFVRERDKGSNINHNWALVRFRSDYTIGVE